MQPTNAVPPLLALILFFAACSQPPPSEDPNAAKSDAQIKAEETAGRLQANEGGRLVLQAIDAHGGLEAWYAAPTSSYTWEYANERGDMRFKTYLVAESSSRRVYHEFRTLGSYQNPEAYKGSFAWDGSQAWIDPPDTPKVNPRFWALTGYYFQQIPFVLADPGVRYEVLPDEELDGEPYKMVKCAFGSGVGDSPGDTYTLYIDKERSRMAAIRYTVTYYQNSGRARKKATGKKKRPSGPRETLFYYEDETTVDGLMVATHFRGFNFADGKVVDFKNEAWASEISFSKPFDESRLAPPESAKIQER